MKLAIDMASILKTCLAVGKDAEGYDVEFEDKKVHINTAAYGYEYAVNSIKAALDEFKLAPIDLIMVTEGLHSKSPRLAINGEYKATRSNRPPEYYKEYEELQRLVREAFKGLGAIEVSQPYVEGDDILAWLAQNTEEDLVVMSNDGDLVQLHGRNAYGADVLVRTKGEIGRNPYGDFDCKLITTYKALVGDTSDNIKGCKGFGEVAFLKFIRDFGEDGLEELQAMLESGSLRDLEALAQQDESGMLAKIFEQRQGVLNSYYLAKMYPEWVDTIDHAIEWYPGMVVKATDERLKHWGAQARLVTADNFAEALKFFKEKIWESPFISFDIETSTPLESDDWFAAQGKKDGVDVLGSYLCGFSFTFGKNTQYTYYVSVAHKATANISMRQAREMIEASFAFEKTIQNLNFELVVLANAKDEDGTSWYELWKDRGQQGYMPNCLDTKLEASYVNENVKQGLKERSSLHLGYQQQTYEEVTAKTLLDGTVIQRKMHEMTAQETFSYGADDTICTAALHNFYKLHMQLEHCYKIYLDVEIAAAYLHAHSYRIGTDISVERLKELDAEDSITLKNATEVLNTYLTEHSWDGTVPPKYVEALTAKEIKDAYKIVFNVDEQEEEAVEGEEPEEVVEQLVDLFLKSKVRTPSKLLAILEEMPERKVFAEKLKLALDGELPQFESYVNTYSTGEPLFKGSNKQMQKLLYEVMGLPVRIRNKATKKMRDAGVFQGSPKGDTLALEYAKMDCTPEQKIVLESVRLVGMVKKRRSDYYNKYPSCIHWKTGRIHSSHNQSSTNTRRASSSNPNFQNLPKHQKVEGQPAKFREVFVPHKRDAVIVSLDFAAQELRVIAERSQDPNMLACYIGDNKKDMHMLTGLGILERTTDEDWTYAKMAERLSTDKFVKDARTLGKKCNFTTEYGAAAPKLAQTLLVSEEEAQLYIDAKEAAFPVSSAWKQSVIKQAKAVGKVFTMLGAPRHLASLISNPDKFIASKADRQAVNYEVQGSSAEMTKLAEGRMWSAGLFKDFDAQYIGPIHDECVASVAISDLFEFIPLMHKCMTAQYANMQVPIESSISFGPNFGEQFEVGEVPTVEAIKKGLEELK